MHRLELRSSARSICRLFGNILDPSHRLWEGGPRIPYYRIDFGVERPHLSHADMFDTPMTPGRVLASLLEMEAVFNETVNPDLINEYQSLFITSFVSSASMEAFIKAAMTPPEIINGTISPPYPERKIYIHHCREAFLGLEALIRRRNDQEAKKIFLAVSNTIKNWMSRLGGWDRISLSKKPYIDLLGRTIPYEYFIFSTTGRMFGPLSQCVALCDGKAGDSMYEVMEKVLRRILIEVKSAEIAGVVKDYGWDTSSIAETMLSLAMHGRTFEDERAIESAASLYDQSKNQWWFQLGWSKKNLLDPAPLGSPEASSAVMGTAIHLARYFESKAFELMKKASVEPDPQTRLELNKTIHDLLSKTFDYDDQVCFFLFSEILPSQVMMPIDRPLGDEIDKMTPEISGIRGYAGDHLKKSTSKIHDSVFTPDQDAFTDVETRTLGMFGGPAPCGYRTDFDAGLEFHFPDSAVILLGLTSAQNHLVSIYPCDNLVENNMPQKERFIINYPLCVDIHGVKVNVHRESNCYHYHFEVSEKAAKRFGSIEIRPSKYFKTSYKDNQYTIKPLTVGSYDLFVKLSPMLSNEDFFGIVCKIEYEGYHACRMNPRVSTCPFYDDLDEETLWNITPFD